MVHMEIRNVGPGKWYVCAGDRRVYVKGFTANDVKRHLNNAMARLAAEVRRTSNREEA